MSDYFTRRGVDVVALRDGVLDRTDLARGPDGRIWSYDRGVWRKDEAVVQNTLIDLIGGRFRLEHQRTVSSMILAAPPDVLEDEGDLERINFRNGMLNLGTGELEGHDRGLYSVTQLPHDWDPGAPRPERFIRFLSEIAPGREKLLLELMGYSLLDGNPYQVAGMLTGSGANGKGVFLHLVGALAGSENRSSVTLQQLSDDRYAPADLLGKLVNIAGDISARWVEDSSAFKAITGGDSIRGERKYEHGFSFHPRAFSLFSANEVPRSADVGYGYLRRWLPVHLPNRFDEEARDTELLGTLLDELPGILLLAVGSLRLMLDHGGFDRELARADVERFRVAVDPLRSFYEEHLERSLGSFLARKDLMQAYRNWAEDNGYRPIPAVRLYRRLEELELEEGRELVVTAMSGVRGFRDIKLEGAFEAPPEVPI